MKFVVNMETNIDVAFDNPEKIKEYFIKSDTFYDLCNLSEHLAYAIVRTPREWCSEARLHYKFIEGFGKFYHVAREIYLLVSDEFSSICVEIIDENEIMGCYEDTE
jgi:hypothetical protein